VIERSKEILAQLEEEHLDPEGRAKIARPAAKPQKTHLQLTLFGAVDHPLLDEIRQTELNNLTPLQALQLLEQWQRSLQPKSANRSGKGDA
jgi:DNA mismatch repair protein MutS